MKRRRLRICFVAEQFVPPVLDGSGLVYKAWLDALSQHHDVYAILFTQYPVDTREATDYLRKISCEHLILPGVPAGRIWKTLRAAARYFSGNLFAPRIIEEYGRGIVKKRISAFLQSNQIDLFVFSKLLIVHQFGYEAIARLGAPCFIDIHDDGIENERMLRAATARLLQNYPSLSHYKPYGRLLMRQRLSRLSIHSARLEERRMLELFDCILFGSVEEWNAYRERLAGTSCCEFLPWPIGVPDSTPAASNTPEFHAGFIGSSSVFNTEGIIYFCTRILPLILQEIPDFRCLIAGRVSDPLSQIGQSWPGVSIEPYVEDVGSFYARIGTSIVPLLGGTGVSLKTLEAIAHGKPVVATSVGVRGIQRELYPDVIVIDDPDLFAQKLIDLSRGDARLKKSRIPHSVVAANFLDAFDRILERLWIDPQKRGVGASMGSSANS
jgi:glycosyltransferase involved in cell wall biosynthesis